MKISQKAKLVVASLAMIAGAVVALPVHAEGTWGIVDGECKSTGGTMTSTECYAALAAGDTQSTGLMGTLQGILNAIFGIIGFIAVVMLIYGGVQYTISSGDAGKVKKAKDTILYGIVGLIIALLAAAIVNFVLVNVLK